MSKVFVTKSFMPPLEKYESYLKDLWESRWLTNQGPLVKELEGKLRDYLNVHHIQYVTNGTIALQLALRALDINEGEIITTPFTYVATTTALMWERCKPVFVDIDPQTLCLDPEKIEAAITPQTKAIMPVHVFGYACDVEKIEAIAQKHHLKVIYDAAHAFGSEYKGRSLLDYGDISTCSFHATKLFHTIEGGALVVKDDAVKLKVQYLHAFGHYYDDYQCAGINGKVSEFCAAMGLCNFDYLEQILKTRQAAVEEYDSMLKGLIWRPQAMEGLKYNYAYYPAVFKSEEELQQVSAALSKEYIFPRRYFYPSINTLGYMEKYQPCPISEDISKRVLCLPLYAEMEPGLPTKISEIIKENLF